MRLPVDCLVCLVRQAVEAGRFLGLREPARETLIRNTLDHLAHQTWDLSAPEIAAETQEFLRNLSGNDDPYKAVKEASTRAALDLFPRWRVQALADPDPLDFALRLSAAGNLIDCGPTGKLDIEETSQRLLFALRRPFAHSDNAVFFRRLDTARTLLLIADNAGELVADRLLLEVIERGWPEIQITVMVRGGHVLNDATREDVSPSGFPPHWRIADTHMRIPGLPLHRCPESVSKAFRTADMIIAKGQGNWETLNSVDHRGLFFLLTCKCPSIAEALGGTVGSTVLRQAARQKLSATGFETGSLEGI